MNTRQTILLCVIGTAAALLAAYLLLQMRCAGVASPAGSQPGSLTHRLNELEAKIAALPDPAVMAERLRNETAEIDASYPLAVDLVPEMIDPAGIGATLADLAQAAGIEMDEFHAGKPESVDGGLDALLLTLRLRGKYDDVAGFVSAVEGLQHPSADTPRRIEIDRIATVPEVETAIPEWDVALRAYSFRSGEGTALDAATDLRLPTLAAQGRFDFSPGKRDIMAPASASAAARASTSVPDEHAGIPASPSEPDPEPAVAAVQSGRDAAAAPDESVASAAPDSAGGGVPVDAPAALPGLTVQGISWSPTAPRVVVNGGILAVGDAVPGQTGMRVAAIDKTAVTFESGGERHIVGVKMFARR